MRIYSNGKMLMAGGSVSQEVYSTEEIVIGRWIDGKPLYRKCYPTTTPSAVKTIQTVAHDADETIEPKFVRARVETDYGGANGIDSYTVPYTDALNNVSMIGIWAKKYNGVSINMGVYLSSNINRPCEVVLEYTKTTDQATIPITYANERTAAEDPLDAVSAIPVTATVSSAEIDMEV